MTAQAATRVTGASAGNPPSLWMVSQTTSSRRMSMGLPPGQAAKIAGQRELSLPRRQGLADEVDGIGLSERERRVASEQQMLRRDDPRGVAQIIRLEAHRVEVEAAQIIADLARQRA